ncbi:CCA tRNA nucleotidyltransferase, mitochondrial [Gryganskiella cystojenkinii]|nr:CCA tRNA nucleotidyltransferase, mitochondrial [Gryganskiella cystojenkinii]
MIFQGSDAFSSAGPNFEIKLTEQEAEICKILDTVTKNYAQQGGRKIELRIAGGWVRDKLLGLACHDLDIGIDTMMGYDFATLVNEFRSSQGHEKRTISKIAINPDRSKHLETATMVVEGMPLDFVNLRSEVYDDTSRIPTEIAFGTPEEDAYRRDITINALFYNIHTRQVEDYTGKGLEDLKNGLVRTPLAAFNTFSQDPLRVMRCIRFASRFNFRIADDAKEAILDPRIKEVLKTKISKERIGAELDKMIDDGAGRSIAIRLLHDLSLYDVVFPPPMVDETPKGTSEVQGSVGSVDEAFKLVWIMEWLLKINPSAVTEFELKDRVFQAEADQGQESLLVQSRRAPFTTHLSPMVTSASSPNVAQIETKEDQFPERQCARSLILSGMVYPYRNMTAVVNKKNMSAATWSLRYGLKCKNHDIEIVTSLMQTVQTVRETVEKVAQTPEQQDEAGVQKERAEMGMVIRTVGFNTLIGKKWPCAFLLGLGIDLLPKFDSLRNGTLDDEAKAQMAKYNRFLTKAAAYHIDHCFSWKYIVSGMELTKLLQQKPGPKVTGYLQRIMYWQLMHPTSSKEECQAWILENRELFQ